MVRETRIMAGECKKRLCTGVKIPACAGMTGSSKLIMQFKHFKIIQFRQLSVYESTKGSGAIWRHSCAGRNLDVLLIVVSLLEKMNTVLHHR